MTEEDTPSHSAVRLLQKLAAYRTSIASTSVSSSPSPKIERHSSIFSESANFFTRLWRATPPTTTSPSSSILLATHENKSSSFDQIPESVSTDIEPSTNSSSSCTLHRRMSIIRTVPPKNSSFNPICHPSSSLMATFQAQQTISSTITDPSLDDMTSEPQFDTRSELLSQSLETNMDDSNPRLTDDKYDDTNFQEDSFTYDKRHKRLDSIKQPSKSHTEELSSLSMLVYEQTHYGSLPSREPSTDTSTVSLNYLIVIRQEKTK